MKLRFLLFRISQSTIFDEYENFFNLKLLSYLTDVGTGNTNLLYCYVTRRSYMYVLMNYH